MYTKFTYPYVYKTEFPRLKQNQENSKIQNTSKTHLDRALRVLRVLRVLWVLPVLQVLPVLPDMLVLQVLQVLETHKICKTPKTHRAHGTHKTRRTHRTGRTHKTGRTRRTHRTCRTHRTHTTHKAKKKLTKLNSVTVDLCGLLNLSKIMFNPLILNKEKYLFVLCSKYIRRRYCQGHRTRYLPIPKTRQSSQDWSKTQKIARLKTQQDSFGQSVSVLNVNERPALYGNLSLHIYVEGQINLDIDMEEK